MRQDPPRHGRRLNQRDQSQAPAAARARQHVHLERAAHQGEIKPSGDSEILFEMWLPLEHWNGKFSGIGNASWGGNITRVGQSGQSGQGGGLSGQLVRGYATASTNTGHQDTTGLNGARFGFESREKLIDFAYRAQHETAVAGKALVEAFYGRPPEHSYFIGNSTGGGQGFMEAQRFPADYDGVVAGQPLNNWTRLMTTLVDAMAVLAKESAGDLPASALESLHRGVLAACDSTDGVIDGVLRDPRQCAFDPVRLQCATTQKAEECLSPSQVATVRYVYGGLKDPANGAQLFPGLAPGSELLWRSAANPHTIPISHYRWLVFRDPSWDWRTFQITDSASYRVFLKSEGELGPLLNATSPDLRAFRARGGKVLHYHGWGDPAVAPQNSIDYFESVVSFFGHGRSNRAAVLREVTTFYRLFMIPGLAHAATDGDVQGALERWVELGTAPETLIATVASVPVAKHLICAYPKVAVYSGTGDTNNVANFGCGDSSTIRRP